MDLDRQDTGAASTASAGANRPSLSHLRIRLAFSACRRATCATDTPGALVSRQIERFSLPFVEKTAAGWRAPGGPGGCASVKGGEAGPAQRLPDRAPLMRAEGEAISLLST
jgi:hypothetical protein